MSCTYRMTLAAAGLAVLTACAEPVPTTAPVPSAAPTTSTTSAPASPSAAPATSSAAPATSGPKLVDADLKAMKSFDIGIGVPVEISSSLDAGKGYILTSHSDGTVDFTGTKGSESARMLLKAAKVRKRTEENSNTLVIMAVPVDRSGPDQCVTDTSKAVLRLEPCVPGDATQAWHLTPEGDFGLFKLTGDHTVASVTEGKIDADGWPLMTSELAR